MSLNSSMREVQYDIIRDDIGYSKMEGKVFYNSIRSTLQKHNSFSSDNHSSKYVSEASKFRSYSELNSSKGLPSPREEIMFSGERVSVLLYIHRLC